jgi:hypothetical protein
MCWSESEENNMAEPLTFERLMSELEIPDELSPFVQASILLLPGETEANYLELISMMILDILPDTNIEWLCTIDLATLWWEIQRYRRWKIAIIMTNRAGAVERALFKTDPAYLSLGPEPGIYASARVDAEKWHNDGNQKVQLNLRLKAHGYDAQGINVEAFGRELSSVSAIERFLALARNQVNVLLREIGFRREFARRARKALDERLAEPSEVKQIAAT